MAELRIRFDEAPGVAALVGRVGADVGKRKLEELVRTSLSIASSETFDEVNKRARKEAREDAETTMAREIELHKENLAKEVERQLLSERSKLQNYVERARCDVETMRKKYDSEVDANLELRSQLQQATRNQFTSQRRGAQGEQDFIELLGVLTDQLGLADDIEIVDTHGTPHCGDIHVRSKHSPKTIIIDTKAYSGKISKGAGIEKLDRDVSAFIHSGGAFHEAWLISSARISVGDGKPVDKHREVKWPCGSIACFANLGMKSAQPWDGWEYQLAARLFEFHKNGQQPSDAARCDRIVANARNVCANLEREIVREKKNFAKAIGEKEAALATMQALVNTNS